jgi:protein-tyrosine phosphatase
VEKLKNATNGAPVKLVVNTAPGQCEAREGFWGPDVKVLCVDLEDDPDERKYFDQGLKAVVSKCRDTTVPLKFRCAGDAKQHFAVVSKEIDRTIRDGGHVVVHCHASLSRSPAYVLAYLMWKNKMSLLEAAKIVKTKWDALWPCDRFSYQLVEYEDELKRPHRMSTFQLYVVASQGFLLGAAVTTAVLASRPNRK